MRLRFFTPQVHLSHRFLARLTQIDYASEMALVAIWKSTNELLGVVRLVLDPDLQHGEYGIIVRTDIKGHGLGWQLMKHLVDYARHDGTGAGNRHGPCGKTDHEPLAWTADTARCKAVEFISASRVNSLR